MATPLVIIGTGGHGRETLDVVEALNAAAPAFEVLGFLDDAPAMAGQRIRGLPVLGPVSWLRDQEPSRRPHAFVGIGSTRARLHVGTVLDELGVTVPVLVHPHAVLTPHVTLERGVLVTAGAVLTSSVAIGAYSFVNVGASVSHDCVVGRWCSIQMGVRLSGNVTLEDGADIGVGAVINQNLRIGAWTIVGSGAAVIESLPPNVTAVGVPARVISTRAEGWQFADPR